MVELRVKGGYSGKEIADKLGIAESAVKARLLRGPTASAELGWG